jgi:hypothetical protein
MNTLAYIHKIQLYILWYLLPLKETDEVSVPGDLPWTP